MGCCKRLAIIEEFVEATWGARNRAYYEALGYEFAGYGTHVIVALAHLPPSAKTKVTVRCDGCGRDRVSPYYAVRHKCYSCSKKDYFASGDPRIEERNRKIREWWSNPENYKPLLRYGPDNPSYNPDRTDADRQALRQFDGYKAWRRAVFERDDFNCIACGRHGGRLHVHHVFNYADYPTLRTDMNNGVTMCADCHRSFHRAYGKRHNTLTQLIEFLHFTREEVNRDRASVVLESFISRMGRNETRSTTEGFA